MPNYCDYDMKITGTKESVKEMIDILNADYNGEETDPIHFYRIFDAEVRSEGIDKDIPDTYSALLNGYCAWSAQICMRNTPLSYYGRFKENDKHYNPSCLENETERLHCKVELFSIEPGCGFAEHILVNNGEVIIDESRPYCIVYKEDTSLDEVNKMRSKAKYPPMTEEEYDNSDEYIEMGGYNNYNFDEYQEQLILFNNKGE